MLCLWMVEKDLMERRRRRRRKNHLHTLNHHTPQKTPCLEKLQVSCVVYRRPTKYFIPLICSADSQVTDHFLLKKKAPRGGKKGKGVESSPEAVAPALDDGSDSGDDEFHDALGK